jgi:hypothetical protein
MTDVSGDYAFPHVDADERRRLDLLGERHDPITIRRVERLGGSARRPLRGGWWRPRLGRALAL